MEERIDELKNDLYCQLFHQTDENAKLIVADYYNKYKHIPEIKEWIEKNSDKLIYCGL